MALTSSAAIGGLLINKEIKQKTAPASLFIVSIFREICSKGTILFNNVTFGFLFCLIKWKNRSDACSNYSVRAHKALFRFLSDDFLKGMLFQLSYDLVSCI